MEFTAESIRKWLIAYAWADTPEDCRAEVECIMAQDGWRNLAARVERTRGQAWDAEQATEAEAFELSALYECHDAPHLPTCPQNRHLELPQYKHIDLKDFSNYQQFTQAYRAP